MKNSELKPCASCGKGLLHTGVPLFWRVKIERFGINLNAVQQQRGLEMFLGSSKLAAVMGTGEQFATPMMEPVELILCETCAMKNLPIVAWAERD